MNRTSTASLDELLAREIADLPEYRSLGPKTVMGLIDKVRTSDRERMSDVRKPMDFAGKGFEQGLADGGKLKFAVGTLSNAEGEHLQAVAFQINNAAGHPVIQISLKRSTYEAFVRAQAEVLPLIAEQWHGVTLQPVAPDPREYLVRKGAFWYRPNAEGYTAHAFEAGLFTFEEARRHSHPNGPGAPRDGMHFYHKSDLENPVTDLRWEH